jgi:guanosine-3',5'-bis(diphosphate) 3'-pyrophosphohydrolase
MIPKTPQRLNLFAFVVLKHHGQIRKYTNEPYVNHLRAVAEMADEKCRFGYEIGLCHDLLEDTDCTKDELLKALIRFIYFRNEAEYIVHCVTELTDIYTPEDFPQLNRAKRKELEAKRLSKITYESQTVKYCDLIDNTESIVKYDEGFAVKYLAEKATILNGMNKGNPVMYAKAKRVLKKALKSIEFKSIVNT